MENRVQVYMKMFFLLGLISFNSLSATLSEQVNAAKRTANTDPSCIAIRPFYWEIGDQLSALVSGQSGIAAPSAKTPMEIASASKLIFSAYVVEKREGQLSVSEKNHLRFLSGYDKFTACLSFSTVESCLNSGQNGERTLSSVGKFAYGGGHMQKLAVTMGLGDFGNAELTTEINSLVGIHGKFEAPQPAGGYSTSSQDYGFFLRNLMNRKLKISALLGTNSICTTPELCPTEAVSSPAPKGWKYSYGHWVETDGTLSSPGKLGFYPWIDQTNGIYGVIGRKSQTSDAYLTSIECGQKIRRAFISGK